MWMILVILGIALVTALYAVWSQNSKEVWPLHVTDKGSQLAEQTFQKTFHKSPLLVCIIRMEDGLFVDVNTTFLKKTFYSYEDVVGKTTSELAIFKEQIWCSYKLFLEREDYLDYYEITLATKGGGDLQGLFSADMLSFEGRPHLLVMIQDITAQQVTQKALVESEQRYRTLFECAQDAILFLHNGRFVDCNQAAVDMFGCQREQLWDCSPMDFSPPWQPGGHASSHRMACLISRAVEGQSQRFEWKFQRIDGQLLDVEMTLNRLDLAGQSLLLAIVRDISIQKQRQKELSAHQSRLRNLANTLSVTEEQIRKRVATFLHDNVCQGLVSCKLMLDVERDTEDIEQLKRNLRKISDSIAQIAEETQGVTVDLASPTLYRLGLAAAVNEWLRDQVESKHGIMTYFECEGDTEGFDEECLAFVYRAIKELAYNTIKHAQAKNLWVTLEIQLRSMVATITDDGVGFDITHMRSSNELGTGLGLLSIRERLDFIGGFFKIQSTLGQGTTIEMEIPASLKKSSTSTEEALEWQHVS